MSSKRFLAFDLGAESGRAIAGLLNNGKIELDILHRFSNGAVEVSNHIFWPVLGLFNQLQQGMAAYGAKYGREVTSMGIDTWGCDFGLLDRNGLLLGCPYHYRDRRTEGIPEKVFKQISKKQLYSRVGIQSMFFNTLYQIYSMVEEDHPLLEAADTMLFMPDLLNYFFTGEKMSEFTIASTSQMYSCAEDQWATDILQSLKIPTSILPQVMAPGSVVGTVLDSIAGRNNVDPAPVVAPGEHDTGSAVAAIPVLSNAGWCYLSSGTWSLMGVELAAPVLNDEAMKLNFTNEGGVDGTIRFLKNIMGMWLVQQCRSDWIRQGTEYTYPQLEDMAAAGRPFQAYIDPNDEVFKAPDNMAQAIIDFCVSTGQSKPESREQIMRIIHESLTLVYRSTLNSLEKLTGLKIETIHVVGGGSKNLLLNQMMADATGKTVVAGPIEATALGNIMMQAIGMGVVGSIAEARSIIRNSFEFQIYEPGDIGPWDEAASVFDKLCTKT